MSKTPAAPVQAQTPVQASAQPVEASTEVEQPTTGGSFVRAADGSLQREGKEPVNEAIRRKRGGALPTEAELKKAKE